MLPTNLPQIFSDGEWELILREAERIENGDDSQTILIRWAAMILAMREFHELYAEDIAALRATSALPEWPVEWVGCSEWPIWKNRTREA